MERQLSMNEAEPNFVVATRQLFKFSKENVGAEFIGRFTGTRERDVMDKEDGEIKTITDLCFENKGLLWAVPLDKGLEIAFKDAGVVSGHLIKITKLEPVKLEKGTCNQYTIAIAQ